MALLHGTDGASCNGIIRFDIQAERGVRFSFYRKNLYLWEDRHFGVNSLSLQRATAIAPCLYSVWCPQYSRNEQLLAFKRNLVATDVADWRRIAIDIERPHSYGRNNPRVLADLRWMLKSIADWHGSKPIIYTRKSIFDLYYSNQPEWDIEADLWVANYSRETPLLPIGWTRWLIWQYSSSPNALGPFYGAQSASQDLNVAQEALLGG